MIELLLVVIVLVLLFGARGLAAVGAILLYLIVVGVALIALAAA